MSIGKQIMSKKNGNSYDGKYKQRYITSFEDYKSGDYFTVAILFLLTGLTPLIVRCVSVPISPEEALYIRNEKNYLDMFSFYKSQMIVILSSLLLVYHALYYLSYPKSFNYKSAVKDPITIAAVVFGLMAVLSSVFSHYPNVVLRGITERYESIFVLLGYLIIFFTVILFASSRFQFKAVLSGIIFSAVVIGIIGLFQYFKMDFFNTKLAKKIVLGEYINMYSMSGLFDSVYATLYNPNPAGLYSVFMFPVVFFTGIYYKDSIPVKILLIVTGIIMLICVIGSRSTGGLLGLIVMLAAAAVTQLVRMIKTKKIASMKAFCVFISITALAACCVLFINPLNTSLRAMINKAVNVTASINYFYLRDIYIEGRTAYVTAANGNFSVEYIDGEYSVNKDGVYFVPVEETAVEENTIKRKYSVDGIGNIDLTVSDSACLVELHGKAMLFYAAEGVEDLMMVTKSGSLIDTNNELTPYIGFEGMELFASSRGYIWSRSLPLLKDSLFLGVGQDAYAMAFPQDDVIGKTRYMGDPYLIVDKPHNLYLQTGINTGVISLIAMLCIFCFYLVGSFKDIVSRVNDDGFIFGLRFGIFLGVISYMASAMATDSIVSISPVFWAVLGLGVAVRNYTRRGLNG